MPTESHLLMDGALHVYRRENSRYWQCSTYLGSRNHRQTTKEGSLAAAKDFERDWYMERCVEDRQRRRGGSLLLDSPAQPLIAGPGASTDGRRRQTPTGPSFEDAAKAFTSEFEIITFGERNPRYVNSKSEHVRIISCRSSAIPRLPTSRLVRCRSTAPTVRLRGSIQKLASQRSRLEQRCIAKWSRCVRY